MRIPADAIEDAIGINGATVAASVTAFRWGWVAVAAPGHFRTSPSRGDPVKAGTGASLVRLVELRAAELVGFQDVKTAEDYIRFVERVRQAARALTSETRRSEAVARYLYKLTAYKDEYEVARLLTAPGFAFRVHPPPAARTRPRRALS